MFIPPSSLVSSSNYSPKMPLRLPPHFGAGGFSIDSIIEQTAVPAGEQVAHRVSSPSNRTSPIAASGDQVVRRKTPQATTATTATPKKAPPKRKRKAPELANQAPSPVTLETGTTSSVPSKKAAPRKKQGPNPKVATAKQTPAAFLTSPNQSGLPVTPRSPANSSSKRKSPHLQERTYGSFPQPGNAIIPQLGAVSPRPNTVEASNPNKKRRITNPNYVAAPSISQPPPQLATGTTFHNSVPGDEGFKSLDVAFKQSPNASFSQWIPSSASPNFVNNHEQSIGPVRTSIEEQATSAQPASAPTRKIAKPRQGRVRKVTQQPDYDSPALRDYEYQLGLLEQQNKKRLTMARQEQKELVQKGSLAQPTAPNISTQVNRPYPSTADILTYGPNAAAPPFDMSQNMGNVYSQVMSPRAHYAVPRQEPFDRERTQTFLQSSAPYSGPLQGGDMQRWQAGPPYAQPFEDPDRQMQLASETSENRTLSLNSQPRPVKQQSFAPSQASEVVPYPLYESPVPVQAPHFIQHDPQFQYVAGVIKNAFAPPGVGPNVKPTPKNAQAEALRYILNRNRSSPEVDEISGLFQREAANSVAPHHSQAVASHFSRPALDLKKGEYFRVNYGGTP